MKKWLVLPLIALLALLGWVAAGPFLTVNAIRNAVKAQDTAELSRHVDFPAVRASLKAQFDDYLMHQAGAQMQADPLGALALRLASGVSGSAVDAIATPAGLGAVLEGRNLMHRIGGGGRSDDTYAPSTPPAPLQGAKYGFESPSRFVATVRNDDGEPVAFVLHRDGLRWRLGEIRLPLDPATSTPE
ncbi:DUF2939 domain-containing protein [Lysobacter cavernae]|uniref:DUF2939 domain-containing protein n=1 Tax=Lysobacter cavernae TaxID=1685901 RepID=A0ABV7RL67_9GAMM